MMKYTEIIKKRRSIYQLSNHIEISSEQLQNLIEQVILESPTAFHMQSSHVVVLMNQHHRQLWKIVEESLSQIVPVEKFTTTQKKLATLSQAKGTLLFFEDLNKLNTFKQQYPLYQDTFDIYSAENMGILIINVWNALAEINIGANLQHYNPLIDEKVHQQWHIPSEYRLMGQLVFGHPLKTPETKDKVPVKSRYDFYE